MQANEMAANKTGHGVENASGAVRGTAKVSGNPGPLNSESRHAAMRFSDQLRKLTLEAPLQSLLMAFVLGVLVDGVRARRPCGSTALGRRGTAVIATA